jgi:hypothetical protein
MGSRRTCNISAESLQDVDPRAKLKHKEGRLADALASRGDEGRGTLRKAMGSREQALIHGYPNGETRLL